MTTEIFLITRILFLAFFSFALAFLFTPILTHYLYKYRFWKKQVRTEAVDGSPIIHATHADNELNTPRMGGLLIWVTAAIVTLGYWILSQFFPNYEEWDFLSRSETWLPLFTLVSAGLVGAIDDFLVIKGKGKYIGGGMAFKIRVLLISAIGLVGAWWFVSKLGFSEVFVPFVGNIDIGWLYGPLFIIVLLALFSSSVVDGLDGLSAGVFSTIFVTFAAIAFARGQYDLATFCAVLLGALLAYLWFNIPPARFFMGETGIIALTTTITVVAFLTNSVFLLPVAGIILVAESASVVIQLLSKKFRGKKVFLAAPIHYHFIAKGWPSYKVTMRIWVISGVFSALALLIFLAGPR